MTAAKLGFNYNKNINAKHTQFSDQRWFITGATGFLGREFIAHLLAQGVAATNIFALVRSGKVLSAKQKFIHSLKDVVNEEKLNCINIVEGDLRKRYFNLNSTHWEQISNSTHIVHMAALTQFDADLTTARQYNVHGVKNVIELARRAKSNGTLQHWGHVSTAYVVGNRTDIIKSGELEYGGKFRNAYEQSKHEAELLLQPLLKEYPLTIFRPSIIIGNSKTGKAGNCSTVYWAIRNYLSGQTKVYAKADTPLDLIPVDFVVSAMYRLIRDDRVFGKTLTLAGGNRTTVSLSEFTNEICRYINSPLPTIINPNKLKLLRWLMMIAKLSKRHKRFICQAESYLPYFSQNPRFDVSETEQLLKQTGITVPHLYEYLPTILNFCLQQSWGKRSKIVGLGYNNKNAANA